MSSLFLEKVPEKITASTMLVEIFVPDVAFKALTARCVKVSDLAKLVKKGKLSEIIEDEEDQSRVLAWLRQNNLIRESKAKRGNEKTTLLPTYPPNPKIVPLERIHLDVGLDGRTGTNRADDVMKSLEAVDDLSAIQAWLAARAGNPNTQGVYRKEAERFLLWCTLEKEIAMSSVGLQEASDYLRWLEQAFIIYPCRRYDIQGKNILKTQEKYYLADVTLKYCLLGYNRKMLDGVLENLVFLEMKRRGYQVYIGKNAAKEIDFIAIRRDEKIYVQVCVRLPENSDREIGNLMEIPDHYPKYVVTTNRMDTGIENGIRIVHLSDFLLAEKWF